MKSLLRLLFPSLRNRTREYVRRGLVTKTKTTPVVLPYGTTAHEERFPDPPPTSTEAFETSPLIRDLRAVNFFTERN